MARGRDGLGTITDAFRFFARSAGWWDGAWGLLVGADVWEILLLR